MPLDDDCRFHAKRKHLAGDIRWWDALARYARPILPDDERRPGVIMLPGGVLPASLAYEALLKELGDQVHAVAKELEVYRDDVPPAGFTLDVEVAGILRCSEEVGVGAIL